MILRSDLPVGVKVAQTIHAAGLSSPGPAFPLDTHAVALQVPDEESLLQLADRLKAAGVPHVLVREPDEPYHGAAMAIGVHPGPREQLRPHFRGLQLVKE